MSTPSTNTTPRPPEVDRTGIENTMYRYALGYDDGDLELVGRCFTEDAVLTLRVQGGELAGPFTGRAAILAMMGEHARSQQDQRRHVSSNVLIEHDGDIAHCVSYLTIFSACEGALTALSTGKYEDELVRTADGWRFTRRHIELDLPY